MSNLLKSLTIGTFILTSQHVLADGFDQAFTLQDFTQQDGVYSIDVDTSTLPYQPVLTLTVATEGEGKLVTGKRTACTYEKAGECAGELIESSFSELVYEAQVSVSCDDKPLYKRFIYSTELTNTVLTNKSASANLKHTEYLAKNTLCSSIGLTIRPIGETQLSALEGHLSLGLSTK